MVGIPLETQATRAGQLKKLAKESLPKIEAEPQVMSSVYQEASLLCLQL